MRPARMSSGRGSRCIATIVNTGRVPIQAEIALSARSILTAAGYGLLVALLFTLWPLGRAEQVRAGVLFRDEVAPERRLPGNLTLRSEWVVSRRDRVQVGGATTALSRDADMVYASLRWDAHRLGYLAYRFGYGEDDDEEAFTTDERTVQTFTLGLLPHPNARVKLEYSHHELVDSTRPDFDHWVVSVGWLF